MAINTDQPQRPADTANQAKRPQRKASAHRVEATNAMALANQGLAHGLQTTLKTAVESQVTIGKQAAVVAHALETGEVGYAAFQQELAALRQEPMPVAPNWGALDVNAIMPSSGEIADLILDVCGFGPSKALPEASKIDGPVKSANP
jgi:hypothetical protein